MQGRLSRRPLGKWNSSAGVRRFHDVILTEQLPKSDAAVRGSPGATPTARR